MSNERRTQSVLEQLHVAAPALLSISKLLIQSVVRACGFVRGDLQLLDFGRQRLALSLQVCNRRVTLAVCLLSCVKLCSKRVALCRECALVLE